MTPAILTNARIILPDGEMHGSVVLDGNRIAEISSRHYPQGLDLHGAMLTPGIIDIHTDYLERELSPRPSADFPLEMALHIMDMRALSCGLTTVVSAARISGEKDGPTGSWRGDGLGLAKAYERLIPHLRAHHLIHVRWSPNFEPMEAILEQLLKLKCIGNLVFNDDMPGQRQFRDVDALIRQFAIRNNVSLEESRLRMQERIANASEVNNRLRVKELVAGRFPLGSHDDTTIEHVVEAFESGATLSEMPCSIEAARKAKELGMMVCMGAPNYYRGGSHCGNLSCHDALAENLVDILCSDYHFPSLLACALRMVENGMPLSSAINLLTLNPARHLGIDKQLGSIEVGKQADLVAFHPRSGFADVTRVWVNGREQLSVHDSTNSTPLTTEGYAAVGEEEAITVNL
jgi:alpha-D-ribose 1-methylphosphonate 5-triphosphate diphosphatase